MLTKSYFNLLRYDILLIMNPQNVNNEDIAEQLQKTLYILTIEYRDELQKLESALARAKRAERELRERKIIADLTQKIM